MLHLKIPRPSLARSPGWYTVWASAFRYKGFRFLWVSLLFSSFAMWMEQVALGWLVLKMTDSPFMVGVAAAIRMAPFFFVGIPSGAIADRVDRHLFLRFISGAQGVVTTSMAALLIAGVAQVWHVLLLTLLQGVIRAFISTVRTSYVYDLVGPKDALNGMSLASLSQRIGGIVGGIGAGFLIATVDVGGAYLAMSASYLVATLILFAITEVGQAAPLQRQSVMENIGSTFRAIRSNRILAFLMVLVASSEMLGFSSQTLFPVFARDVLGVGADGLGIMVSVRSGGALLGIAILAALGNYRRKGLLTLITLTMFGAGLVAFSQAEVFVVALALLALFSVASGMTSVLQQTLMQTNVPNEERGRAMGSWVVSIGLSPVGHLETGAVAGALGAPFALAINGVVLATIAATCAVAVPRIRRLT